MCSLTLNEQCRMQMSNRTTCLRLHIMSCDRTLCCSIPLTHTDTEPHTATHSDTQPHRTECWSANHVVTQTTWCPTASCICYWRNTIVMIGFPLLNPFKVDPVDPLSAILDPVYLVLLLLLLVVACSIIQLGLHVFCISCLCSSALFSDLSSPCLSTSVP